MINTSNIPDNPIDRLPKEMRWKINAKKPFVDVHTHIFTEDDIPHGFLGMRFPVNRATLLGAGRVLHNVVPMTRRDPISRLAAFLKIMRKPSSMKSFEHLYSKYYERKFPDSIFGVLTVDMDYSIKGSADRSILDQLQDIAKVRDAYPHRVIPFFNVHPDRTGEFDALELFKKAFDFSDEGALRYFGLKIYPSLGYLPSHPVLMEMYAVCEQKGIPVLTHCSSGLTHSTNSLIDNVRGVFVKDDGTQVDGPHRFSCGNSRAARVREYRTFFNKPHHWIPVMERYPNLKLNLAHFGGDESWKTYTKGEDTKWVDTIIQLMHDYPNVYADFSYTMYKRKFNKELKRIMEADPVVADRTLFGSDYYMILNEGMYGEEFNQFRRHIGEDWLEKIAVENNNRYLFGI